MRKMRLFLTAAAVMCVLAGCAGGKGETAKETSQGGQAQTEQAKAGDDGETGKKEEGAGAQDKELFTCLISEAPAGVPFTDLTWTGFEQIEQEYGATVKLIEALDKAEYSEQIRAMAEMGANPIYTMFDTVNEVAIELAPEYPEVAVRVIPGVTAACAGAAVLGAPLMHDFAVISLSDRLTPMETIWKRLELAAEGDFVICLYNPSSKARGDYLAMACDRLLARCGGERICGIVRNIGRQGQEYRVMTLRELRDWKADMFTTVFVGNTQTRRIGDYMVTPR